LIRQRIVLVSWQQRERVDVSVRVSWNGMKMGGRGLKLCWGGETARRGQETRLGSLVETRWRKER